jgi:hypothetical protein
MKRVMLSIMCVSIVPAAWAGVSTAPRKSEFEKALKVIMSTVAPNRPTSDIDRIVSDYEDDAPNKAIAIEPVYGKTWRVKRIDTADEAGSRALEACQLRYNKPCALVGINEQIVSDGSLVPKDMPRLHYQGKFDIAQIPIISAARRTAPDLRNYDQMPEPKAIVMHPWGFVYVSRGAASLKDAQATMLTKCQQEPERNGKDGDCFIYAVNNDVVLSKRLTSPQTGTAMR